jgi:hypothetical protein
MCPAIATKKMAPIALAARTIIPRAKIVNCLQILNEGSTQLVPDKT